jgi:predicted aldo/keto reductase-like oxidoreductase
LSFSQEIIPLLTERNIGIIGMKSASWGSIPKNNIATIEECLTFAMSLPVSTVISGMDKIEYLNENVKITKSFTPMSEEKMTALLEKTYEHAQGGVHEWYKKTTY